MNEYFKRKPGDVKIIQWFVFIVFYTLFTPVTFSQFSILKKEIPFTANTSIFLALKELEGQTGYYFSYDADLFDANRQVEIDTQSISLQGLLDMFLTDRSLLYKVIGNQIVIYKSEGYTNLAASLDSLGRPSSVRIAGQILEHQRKQAIPYATITFKGNGRGVVANNEGYFTLIIPVSALKDTLAFSCLGFKAAYLEISKFLESRQKVYLDEDYVTIQEVVIRQVNPVFLIKQAIERRPLNYSLFPYNFQAFYRESIQKGKEYIAVTEAVVEGYKSAYLDAFSTDQVKVIKGRKLLDIQQSDTILVKMQAGLKTILLQDVVKNLPDFLGEGNTEIYNYTLKDIVVIGQEDSYLIDFLPKDLSGDAFYKGKMYIDDKTYAIRDVEFQLQHASLSSATSLMVLKRPKGYMVKLGGAHYSISFKKVGTTYFIHYLRSDIDLKVRKKNGLFNSTYNMVNEMVITSVDTTNAKRIAAKEEVKFNEVLKEQIGPYDEKFWEGFNYIPPERPLLEALEEINR